MKMLYLPILAISVAACSSNFVTRPYDPAKDAKEINGIKYYEAAFVRVRYEFTALTDRDGNYLGSSSDSPPACARAVQKEELAVWPDPTNVRVVENKPSAFSSTTFGVTLSNGMLVGVNAQAAPQTATLLGPFLSAAAAFSAKAVPPVAGGPAKICNASPVIASVTPVKSLGSLQAD